MMSRANHPLQECEDCLWPFEYDGCEVFTDKRDVILNKNGTCNGRIIDPQKYRQLLRKIEEYHERHAV